MKNQISICSRSRGIKSALVGIMVLLAGAGVSHVRAELVTVNFTATVTDTTFSVPVGSLVTGSYTYESTTPDAAGGSATRGQYDGAIQELSLSAVSSAWSLGSGLNSIWIVNDFNGPNDSEDRYILSAPLGSGGTELEINLRYFGANEWDSDALVTSAPGVPGNGDGAKSFRLIHSGSGKVQMRARILSFELAADTTAPSVAVSVANDVLWSPNHKLTDIGLDALVVDDRDQAPEVEVFIYSNEPDDATGGGTAAGDAVIGADGSVSVRSDRAGSGSGRVYLIVVAAVDEAGNVGYDCATVVVPKSKNRKDVEMVLARAVGAEAEWLISGVAPAGWFALN